MTLFALTTLPVRQRIVGTKLLPHIPELNIEGCGVTVLPPPAALMSVPIIVQAEDALRTPDIVTLDAPAA